MNIRRGLQRISAVFWGAVTLLGLGVTGALMSDAYRRPNMQQVAEIGLIGFCISLAVGYGLHRLTCWVIAGFASNGPDRQ